MQVPKTWVRTSHSRLLIRLGTFDSLFFALGALSGLVGVALEEDLQLMKKERDLAKAQAISTSGELWRCSVHICQFTCS